MVPEGERMVDDSSTDLILLNEMNDVDVELEELMDDNLAVVRFFLLSIFVVFKSRYERSV